MAQSRTLVVIQARLGSTRMPGKVLAPLAGRPAIAWTYAAAAAAPGVHEVVVATSDAAADDAVAAWGAEAGAEIVRGPVDDVLARFILAIEGRSADRIVRLTADCPFLDPAVISHTIALHRETGCDFATNAESGTWPDGLDVEVMSAEVLRLADREAARPAEREHVTPFIRARQDRFDVRHLTCPIPGLGGRRWTLDTPEDYARLTQLAEALPGDRPPALIEVLEAERALAAAGGAPLADAGSARNAAYAGLLPTSANDRNVDFNRSQAFLDRALKTVPTGAQTFSKAAQQYPKGRAPLFLSHGLGGRVWDLDGNEYVDAQCALLAVSIGYRDAEIDDAVRRQMARGVSLTLPTRLEAELAERLVEYVPCAEAARFGKNGTDATSGAVRVARAYTGRDKVAVCGYHGWQDWYIGSTARDRGVPAAVKALTLTFPYNDLAALDQLLTDHPGEIAAVVMEAANFTQPAPGFLEGVRALTEKHGVVLVFDEIITGFRFDMGGAQGLFGVTPDLACLGKGMANGHPIAALVGKQELMAEVDRIFFSGTFGGEALSLAASIAVVDLMAREDVIGALWRMGGPLAEDLTAMIAAHGLQDTLSVKGWAPWTLVAPSAHPTARVEAIRTLMIREMLAEGVLTLGTNNLCYRHTDADLAAIRRAWERCFETLARELATGELEARLDCPAIEPIFQVRKN